MAGGNLPNAKFKAAAVHAAPVYMDKAATTAKVLRLIEQASKESVSLLVFPEVFVPGFPVGSFASLCTVFSPSQTLHSLPLFFFFFFFFCFFLFLSRLLGNWDSIWGGSWAFGWARPCTVVVGQGVGWQHHCPLQLQLHNFTSDTTVTDLTDINIMANSIS